MRARGAVLILVLVLAAMLGWLFHSRFYWARENTWVGFQGEALDNDFLAAQRLLQRTGHSAAWNILAALNGSERRARRPSGLTV